MMSQVKKDENQNADDDLDISFEKLNFGPPRSSACVFSSGGKTLSLPSSSNNQTKPTVPSLVADATINGNIHIFNFNKLDIQSMDFKKIYKTRKKKRPKSIIQKAKLVLPKELQTVKKDYSSNDISIDESDNLDYGYRQCQCLSCDVTTDQQIQTCKRNQYLHQNCRTDTFVMQQVDSNPDELASYFEQMLYIPKPMSLMAEMMYA